MDANEVGWVTVQDNEDYLPTLRRRNIFNKEEYWSYCLLVSKHQ